MNDSSSEFFSSKSDHPAEHFLLFNCSHFYMQEISVEWLTECGIFRVFPQPEGEFLGWAGDKQMTSRPAEITQLLIAWNQGDQAARDELMPLVYDELRRLARGYLRRERPNHTLQPTALVHDAFLRLVDQSQVNWQNRAHFLGAAARLMRQILINHAEARRAAKRGGSADRVSLDDVDRLTVEQEVDLTALNEALKKLERLDPMQGRIVEMRFFGGLTIEETAEATGVSSATVKREWSTARAWLRRELSR
jgi:RNA polymerase sigma factor (TIGR02999 family)